MTRYPGDTLLNPGRDVGRVDEHEITAKMVPSAPTFEDVRWAVADRLDGAVLVTHNLDFVERMLGGEFETDDSWPRVPIRESRCPQVVHEPTISNSESTAAWADRPFWVARLGVSERFVRRLIAERRVPFFEVGKFIRFDSNDSDQWIENRRVV